MELFERAGVQLQGVERAPVHDSRTMETNVPGLYVAGTAVGGTQIRFEHFISTSHDHVARIVRALTGHLPQELGTVPARNNAVSWEEVKAN
jgi:thioredoxin reductase (NADPH)